MKKAQILSAIALAFALGLTAVAPVANTYAQITPNTATQEQKDAIYEQANEALEAAADLDNVSDYTGLYSAIEGDGGLVAALNKITESELRWFNENLTVPQSVNQYIAQAAKYIGTTSSKLYHQTNGKYDYIKTGVDFSDAELKPIAQFGKVNTLEEAYNALTDASKAVEDNISTLKNNYDYDATLAEADYTVVEKAIANYDAIRSHLSSELTRIDDAYEDGTAWNFDTKTNDAVIANTTTPANLAQLIKNIDAEAYAALTKNANWVAAPTTGVERATDFGLAIKAAKALPKYNFVNGVNEAVKNVEKILSPAAAGDPTVNVDYDKAQTYIAALNTAVEAYVKGKAPVVVDPSKPGEGENQPGDGDGEGEDKPGVADTGVIAAADGTASSTVAIVAGIATALTAAGAGVVAYRNARRAGKEA